VISNKGFQKARDEIDKCVLLCRNCHTAYHAEEWDAKFIKRDGLGWTIEEAWNTQWDED
jgi:hypothetical protein